MPDHEPQPAELLQRPIDMNRCQPEAIGEVSLGQGQTKPLLIGQADNAQAGVKLTQQMGHPRQRVLASQTVKPLALDGAVDSHFEQKHPAQVREALCNVP
ncbi:hypothetical protein D3C80_1790240 [compost metagenome]